MTKEPLFSIIVPVFQCESTLRECLYSVLSQDGSDYELILIDDGSSDGSGAICDAFAGESVRVVHKDNEGPLSARLDGIALSRGSYLLFLDSDDVLLPGSLNRLREVIEDRDVDIAIFNYLRFSEDGGRLPQAPKYQSGEVFEGESLRILYVEALSTPDLNSLWQKCVKRDAILDYEQYRRFGDMHMGEDKILSLGMLRNAKKVVYISEELYGYRVRPEGLSRNRSLKSYQDMALVHREMMSYIDLWELDGCLPLCCKGKVEFGMGCLSDASRGVGSRKSSLTEFSEISNYVVHDDDFWDAFRKCERVLGLRFRVVCSLLAMECVLPAFAVFRFSAALRSLRRGAHRLFSGLSRKA